MHTILSTLVGLGMLAGHAAPPTRGAAEPDLAQLAEALHDRLEPRAQSQAALLLVQSGDPAAAKLVRTALRQQENEETFIALAMAIRLRHDGRFLEELMAGLSASKPRVRQAAAETLANLPVDGLVRRLEALARNPQADLRVRQTALWALGRCGRKDAAGVLVDFVSADAEDLRRVAVAGLADLTGQNHGLDASRWREWWGRHRNLSNEQWLQGRLAFQATRAQRLDGELLRARALVLRLHQQLYSRLPVAERFTYLQTLLEQEDPGVRALAIVWCLELLPAADTERQSVLSKVLLRLSNDGNPEVQRAAVLALGRMPDAAAFERLQEMLKGGSPAVKAAAVRSLALQARGAAEARGRLKQVVPLLQRALRDAALEVVVEAAEALGALGDPEAGPVLVELLQHKSDHVRQTAAQALERTAEVGLIDCLMQGLDDPLGTVRFSLVGALSRAASGQAMAAEQRKRLLARLEALLKNDTDAGVRSRAATVLGECGDEEVLAGLWQQVLTSTEGRVQEKAWEAFAEVLVRAGSFALVERWDRALAEAKQPSRRVQMWAQVQARWEQLGPAMREQAAQAMESLIQAHLDAGKWAAAAPLVQGLLARSAGGVEAVRSRWLKWLLQAGGMALAEGNRAEALRIAGAARAYLPRGDRLAEKFDLLEKEARQE